jgi:hypothetical protein
MSVIDPASHFVSPYELSLGKIQPTDPTLTEVVDVPYQPTSIIDQGGEITFDIVANSEEYMRLSEFALTYGGVLVNAETGRPITANDNVGPIQNAGHSFFSGYTVQFGHEIVSNCPEYPLQAYLSTHLYYNQETKGSLLSNTGWADDTPGYADAVPGIDNKNEGLKTRTKQFALGKTVYFRIRLVIDVFNVEKLLPSNVPIRLTLYRANPQYCLMAGKTADGKDPPAYRVNIIRPTLWVTKVRLRSAVLLGQSKAMKEEDALLKINKTCMRVSTIPAGVQSYTIDNLTTGQVPKCLFYGLSKNKGVIGDYQVNPLNFEHANVSQTSLYVNGKQHPLIPFRPNYAEGDYGREFYSVHEATGKRYGNAGMSITYDSYPLRDCLYGYDLTSNRSVGNSSSIALLKHGPTRIDFQFSKPLEEAMSMVAYIVYDTIIKINGDYTVTRSNPLLK